MPALSAIRFNPEFKAKYEAFVKAGKPATVAVVAIMRKLSLPAALGRVKILRRLEDAERPHGHVALA
jgi:hypothetical protein